MADLAPSAVELLDMRRTPPYGQPGLVTTRLALTLTGQGTVADKITAEALGFHSIWNVSNAVEDDNSEVRPATPSADGSYVLLKAAGTFAPAAATGTYIITVTGESSRF